MTNNPRKFVGLEGYGLTIAERVPIEIAPSDASRRYLRTKKEKLGHLLRRVARPIPWPTRGGSRVEHPGKDRATP